MKPRNIEDKVVVQNETMIRTHVDPKLLTILECYSVRRKGMGYALLKNNGDSYKLVEAESRWLSSAEQNYGMTI